MDSHKGVLVCGEIAGGKLAPITIELLGIGRKLANELGEDLTTLLMGGKTGGLGQEAIAYGADNVYVSEDNLRPASTCHSERSGRTVLVRAAPRHIRSRSRRIPLLRYESSRGVMLVVRIPRGSHAWTLKPSRKPSA